MLAPGDGFSSFSLWPLFALGLFGTAHCIGMCGGIVGALSISGAPRFSFHLAYHAGRIASYTFAGALSGALSAQGAALAGQFPLRLAFFFLANLLLIATGFYLMGATQSLAWLERAGQKLWRRIQPLSRRFLPARHPAHAFTLGLLWGWLPCGLVYTALAAALLAGSPRTGAAMLFVFGLGTLPSLLLATFLFTRLRAWAQKPFLRGMAGFAILAFGFHGLYLGLHQAVNFTK
jgi:sulfite exporter TauE/SafE